jgi:hypothetical protein
MYGTTYASSLVPAPSTDAYSPVETVFPAPSTDVTAANANVTTGDRHNDNTFTSSPSCAHSNGDAAAASVSPTVTSSPCAPHDKNTKSERSAKRIKVSPHDDVSTSALSFNQQSSLNERKHAEAFKSYGVDAGDDAVYLRPRLSSHTGASTSSHRSREVSKCDVTTTRAFGESSVTRCVCTGCKV